MHVYIYMYIYVQYIYVAKNLWFTCSLPDSDCRDIAITQLLQTLNHLPITTRNQVADSHLITMVTRWLKPTTKPQEQVTGPPQPSLPVQTLQQQEQQQQQRVEESNMEGACFMYTVCVLIHIGLAYCVCTCTGYSIYTCAMYMYISVHIHTVHVYYGHFMLVAVCVCIHVVFRVNRVLSLRPCMDIQVHCTCTHVHVHATMNICEEGIAEYTCTCTCIKVGGERSTVG